MLIGIISCLITDGIGEERLLSSSRNTLDKRVTEIQKAGKKVLDFEIGDADMSVVGKISTEIFKNDWVISGPDLEKVWEVLCQKVVKNPLKEAIDLEKDFEGSVEELFLQHSKLGQHVACYISFQGVNNIWEWDDIKAKRITLPKGNHSRQDIWLTIADALNCKHVRMFCSVPSGESTIKLNDGTTKREEYFFDYANVEVLMFKE